MPSTKHVSIFAISVVCLGVSLSRSLAADPPSEPLPPAEASQHFGYSEPELALAPEPNLDGLPAANSAVFPYGAPLVEYESAHTCWPHNYCHCHYSSCKRRAQCRAWGYPEEFCERPFGSFVRSHLHKQVANGLADQMAIYQYDFHDLNTQQADMLKPRGVRQVVEVAKLATMLYDQFNMVTVEATGDSELDHRRRLQVFEKLTELGAPIALSQIITGRPEALGLDGVEAVEVYDNQLQSTKQQGGTISGSSTIGGVVAPFAGPR